jgi:acyl carrier protein
LDRSDVAQRARELLIDGLRLEVSPDDIADGEPIFGPELGLDSIDVLEFVVLVEQEFGVVISDEDVVRQAFSSISALTDFILSQPETAASS